MAELQPLGKRILVKPMEKEVKTKGGLIIPDTASEDKKSSMGKVVKLGKTRKAYDFRVAVGDTVIFKKYAPEELEVDGEEYLIIAEKDILAVLK